MSSRREHLRLHDIVEEIEAIQKYVSDFDSAEFARHRLIVDATERCLERVIEAIMKIGQERMSSIAPELPFDQIRGLGNRLRHAYDTIDSGPIFAIVRDELPKLRAACIAELEGG